MSGPTIPCLGIYPTEMCNEVLKNMNRDDGGSFIHNSSKLEMPTFNIRKEMKSNVPCDIRQQWEWAIYSCKQAHGWISGAVRREKRGVHIRKRTQWELMGYWQWFLYRPVWWLQGYVYFVIVPNALCFVPFCVYM